MRSIFAPESGLLPPCQKNTKRLVSSLSLNEQSILVTITVAEAQVVLMADRGLPREPESVLELEREHPAAKIQVLQVGHHGSGSTSSELLRALQPDFAIVSAGKSKLGSTAIYGYPEVSVLKRLEAYFSSQFSVDSAVGSSAAVLAERDNFISACERSEIANAGSVAGSAESELRWRRENYSPRILATAESGSIDVYVNEHSVCVLPTVTVATGSASAAASAGMLAVTETEGKKADNTRY